jgi:hypothetical protein
LSICFRILTITLSEDVHLTKKDMESIWISDVCATVFQWAQTLLNCSL